MAFRLGHFRLQMVLAYYLFLIALVMILWYPAYINIYYVIIPFIFNAVAYSINSPIAWSIFKYEVQEDMIGTVYGIVFATYNLIGIFPYIIYGDITDDYNDTREGFFRA